MRYVRWTTRALSTHQYARIDKAAWRNPGSWQVAQWRSRRPEETRFMTNMPMFNPSPRHIDRRTLLASAAAGVLAASVGGRDASAAVGGDDEIAHWTPDYVTRHRWSRRSGYGGGMREGRAARRPRASSPTGMSGRTRRRRHSTRSCTTSSGRRSARPIPTSPSSVQPRLQPNSRQAPHGGARQRRAVVARLMLLWAPELAAKGMLARVEARGCRLSRRRISGRGP